MTMDIIINSQVTPDYLLIEAKGEVRNEEELKAQGKILYDEIQKHDCKKILLNEPETRFPKNILMYYNLVSYYVNNFPPEIRSLKIAVVISPEFEEMGNFWETVCVNHGLQYFVFTSFAEAEAWLTAN